MAQLFLQKQVAVLGEQKKGDLGSLTRSPFGIGCLAGFEQEGKVEGLLAQERACSSGEGLRLQDGRTSSWGGADLGRGQITAF